MARLKREVIKKANSMGCMVDEERLFTLYDLYKSGRMNSTVLNLAFSWDSVGRFLGEDGYVFGEDIYYIHQQVEIIEAKVANENTKGFIGGVEYKPKGNGRVWLEKVFKAFIIENDILEEDLEDVFV